MEQRDYYSILGVAKTASPEEIKAAYRKMALKHHPDRNPNDKDAEGKFKEAAHAYGILSDPQKRKNYDQFGHAGVEGGNMGGSYSHSDVNMEDIFSSFGDIFGDIFGSKSRQSNRGGLAPQKGHDLHQNIKITLKQAYLGIKKELSYYRFFSCSACDGKGAQSGTKVVACARCQGAGQINYRQGFFMYAQTCTTCAGQGYTIPSPCLECKGKSRVQNYEKFLITIPEGIHDGAELRVQGRGDAGVYGGSSGDLFITIKITPEKNFKRIKDDLVCSVMLTYPQLVLGSQIEITSIDGTKQTIKIPKGCPIDEHILLQGKGFKNMKTAVRGNLVVITKCHIPKKLDVHAKKLLVEYAKELDTSIPPTQEEGISSFFKKFLG